MTDLRNSERETEPFESPREVLEAVRDTLQCEQHRADVGPERVIAGLAEFLDDYLENA